MSEKNNSQLSSNLYFFKSVWRMTQALSGNKPLSQALCTCLEIINEYLQATSAVFWLLSPTDNKIYVSAASGSLAYRFDGKSLNIGEAIEGECVETMQPRLVDDFTNDPSLAGRYDLNMLYLIKTALCVPVISEDGCIGCIEFLNKIDGKFFTQGDLDLCETMAALIAVALSSRGIRAKARKEERQIMRFDSVTKRIDKGADAGLVLDSIDLSVNRGEMLVINGADERQAKALISLFCVMDTPDSGVITMSEHDLSQLGQKDLLLIRRNDIGMVLPDMPLMPGMNTRANVHAAAKLALEPMEVAQALDFAGVSARSGRQSFPRQLSSEQDLRTRFARAIVKRPLILIAKEPGDEYLSKVLSQLLKKAAEELDCAVVAIGSGEYFMEEADRVITILGGVYLRSANNFIESGKDSPALIEANEEISDDAIDEAAEEEVEESADEMPETSDEASKSDDLNVGEENISQEIANDADDTDKDDDKEESKEPDSEEKK
ncbi:MAG: GAF domain-containing protein [Clostridia bacterium]|nr:GAF domain-containing protein [Clostridia bacterium]